MHLASATAPGSAHINPGQPGKINNQDALAIRELTNGLVAVLCDGCSSLPFSGIGADIGANIIAQILKASLPTNGQIKNLNWSKLTAIVVQELRKEIAKYTADNSVEAFEKAVTERFLFTATALVAVGDLAVVASFGDGLVIVDDEIIDPPPPILNSPPYLGYLLLQNSAYHTPELNSHLQFLVIKKLELSKLAKGLVVGTDGLRQLLDEDLHHPALVQPKTLQRWLNAQTTEKIEGNTIIQGRCHDDVTLIIVRTEEAQERLFKNRVKIAELKQDLTELQKLLDEFSRDLDRTNLTLKEAEAKTEELSEKIQAAAAKAKAIKSFENKADDLKARLENLSQDLPKKTIKPAPPASAEPAAGIIREFIDEFPYYYGSPHHSGPSYPPVFNQGGVILPRTGRCRTLEEAEQAYAEVANVNQGVAKVFEKRPKRKFKLCWFPGRSKS